MESSLDVCHKMFTETLDPGSQRGIEFIRSGNTLLYGPALSKTALEMQVLLKGAKKREYILIHQSDGGQLAGQVQEYFTLDNNVDILLVVQQLQTSLASNWRQTEALTREVTGLTRELTGLTREREARGRTVVLWKGLTNTIWHVDIYVFRRVEAAVSRVAPVCPNVLRAAKDTLRETGTLTRLVHAVQKEAERVNATHSPANELEKQVLALLTAALSRVYPGWTKWLRLTCEAGKRNVDMHHGTFDEHLATLQVPKESDDPEFSSSLSSFLAFASAPAHLPALNLAKKLADDAHETRLLDKDDHAESFLQSLVWGDDDVQQ